MNSTNELPDLTRPFRRRAGRTLSATFMSWGMIGFKITSKEYDRYSTGTGTEIRFRTGVAIACIGGISNILSYVNDQVRVVTRSLSRLEVVRGLLASPRLSQDKDIIAKPSRISAAVLGRTGSVGAKCGNGSGWTRRIPAAEEAPNAPRRPSIEDLPWQVLAACAETGDRCAWPVWIVERDPWVDETYTA